MKPVTILFFAMGLILLALGAMDVYNLLTVWQGAMGYYAGSNVQVLVQALGRAQVAGALIKLVVGVLSLAVAIRRHKQARGA